MHAPIGRSGPDGSQKAGGATLELHHRGNRIARIGRWLVHEKPRIDFGDGTGKVHERVQYVQTRTGHPPARGLAWIIPPSAYDAGAMLITEMTLHMQDVAKDAAHNDFLEFPHGRKTTLVVAEAKDHARVPDTQQPRARPRRA